VRVHAFTCGWLTGPAGLFLAGAEGRLRVPVPVFLIDHPKGRVVFDTGLHVALQSDPKRWLGDLATVFRVDYAPGEDVAARLKGLGVDSARVDLLVLSHLHFDHAGGVAALPNARIVVQRREWEAGRDPDLAKKNYFDPRDFDHGHDRLLVDGEHDVFGDGRVVCVPTHGHTPGHQSLRLRLDDGRDVLLAADACYLRRSLDELLLPGLPWDADAMLAVLRRFRALRDAGVRIVYGHDPDDWATVPQAPTPLG